MTKTKNFPKGVKCLRTAHFNNNSIEILEYQGQKYMTSKAVAQALGYNETLGLK